MPTAERQAYLERAFLHFADICRGQSPLYETLSRHIAADPQTLALADGGAPRQPPVNLLLGAVHELLLAGADHDLAGFYPSVGGGGDPQDAWPAFAGFCREHAPAIAERVATRRVQTNEVGRCGPLLLAMARAWRDMDFRPLAMIEIGCSAGLLLCLDRYHYEYHRDGRVIGVCGPDSPARVRTELRGDDEPWLPDQPPPVAERIGIDIAPVDVTDAQAIRWTQALIWPDQTDRHGLFQAAVAVARRDPPALLAGDGLEAVAGLVDAASPEAVPVVYHSHATCQMSSAWRDELAARVRELGGRRDLAHVSLEWLGDDPGPRLRLTTCRGGEARTTWLADCHHHGAWAWWQP